MHSRHSSIYQAAEEWLDSFNDSECILTDSDEDGESFESSLGPEYFSEDRSVDAKSSRSIAGTSTIVACRSIS